MERPTNPNDTVYIVVVCRERSSDSGATEVVDWIAGVFRSPDRAKECLELFMNEDKADYGHIFEKEILDAHIGVS